MGRRIYKKETDCLIIMDADISGKGEERMQLTLLVGGNDYGHMQLPRRPFIYLSKTTGSPFVMLTQTLPLPSAW